MSFNSSRTLSDCQICGNKELSQIAFFGYLPPVNSKEKLALLLVRPLFFRLICFGVKNVAWQLESIVDKTVLFPPEYPYTSGTTRILKENFVEMCEEYKSAYCVDPSALVVDIGSNDGTLLSQFQSRGFKVCGVEPTEAASLALGKGVMTIESFFDESAVQKIIKDHGHPQLITAANVFAHIDNVHSILTNILALLDKKGIFISESHYFPGLISTLQYDTVYHEHLRYYSLTSLQALFEMHEMEVVQAKKIPTHGGSIRVYAARKKDYKIDSSVEEILQEERKNIGEQSLKMFKSRVAESKLKLMALLHQIRSEGSIIYGVGAPSRATTLINYTGIDENILDCIVEIGSSHKLNKFLPGTAIPVLDEANFLKST